MARRRTGYLPPGSEKAIAVQIRSNKKNSSSSFDIYIGGGVRNSKWKLNPSIWQIPKILRRRNQKKTLELYEDYIRRNIHLWQALPSLIGKRLGDFKTLKQHHGVVLCRLLEEYLTLNPSHFFSKGYVFYGGNLSPLSFNYNYPFYFEGNIFQSVRHALVYKRSKLFLQFELARRVFFFPCDIDLVEEKLNKQGNYLSLEQSFNFLFAINSAKYDQVKTFREITSKGFIYFNCGVENDKFWGCGEKLEKNILQKNIFSFQGFNFYGWLLFVLVKWKQRPCCDWINSYMVEGLFYSQTSLTYQGLVASLQLFEHIIIHFK